MSYFLSYITKTLRQKSRQNIYLPINTTFKRFLTVCILKYQIFVLSCNPKITIMEKKKGRPKIFNSPEEMQSRLDEYYEHAKKNGEPLTMVGFCAYAGLTDDTFKNYERNDVFFGTVKKARAIFLNDLQKNALIGKYNPAVSIFLMKANYGLSDKPENESDDKTVNINIKYPGQE